MFRSNSQRGNQANAQSHSSGFPPRCLQGSRTGWKGWSGPRAEGRTGPPTKPADWPPPGPQSNVTYISLKLNKLANIPSSSVEILLWLMSLEEKGLSLQLGAPFPVVCGCSCRALTAQSAQRGWPAAPRPAPRVGCGRRLCGAQVEFRACTRGTHTLKSQPLAGLGRPVLNNLSVLLWAKLKQVSEHPLACPSLQVISLPRVSGQTCCCQLRW